MTSSDAGSREPEPPGEGGRPGSLLSAVTTVVGEIELVAVLRRVVEAAVELVGAEYGALGVISGDRHGLDQFIHVGVPPELAAQIGHLPRGHGLLGAVISEAQAIRLEHLGADPRSAGFPPHHPAMQSFLGAPIRIGGEVFGNLYLTNARGGSFTSRDESLLEALASTAGLVIANSRLFEETRTRAAWTHAAAELSRAILTTPREQVFDLIAGRVRELEPLSLTAVLVPAEGGGAFHVAAVRGDGERTLLGREFLYAQTTVAAALEGELLRRGPGRASGDPLLQTHLDEAGPAIAAPLVVKGMPVAAVVISRPPTSPEYRRIDLDVLEGLCSQAAVAVELAQARRDQQRAVVAEERARIARDLHDHVIQQLFGAGLTIQSIFSTETQGRHGGRGQEVVAQIDDAIRQIRTVIFALSSSDASSVRHKLIDIVAEAAGQRERAPSVRFSGPVDSLLAGPVGDDVVAVARELISNSVRHAQADSIELHVAVKDEAVTVRVADDGAGIRSDRRSGLRNLRDRAARRGGDLQIASSNPGTVVTWQVPLIELGGES
ncbi:GAF domain-containing protein [Microbacterium sp. SORGH_AS_0505]|uniref:GAF domain-containing sensor histidine kinase n=1 Tax=Microbacterium sp. SORGH_AS_0505 TaxID=3041770 RepID=UPI0027D8B804|nr:GAF domain-containing protein [Microbacterium sp. SORGH_AS_0505]